MRRVLAAALAVIVVGCSAADGGDSVGQPDSTAVDETAPDGSTEQDDRDVENGDEQRYPDVIDVDVRPDNGTYAFDVTISSPYDTPERYADGWRVVGPDGAIYGEHTLMHDHANEQPFTRTQSGVEIPDGVDEVTVEGRDSEHGFGGETMTVPLPHR